MAQRKQNDFLLVEKQVLPEVFRQVIAVKKGLEDGTYRSVNQAVKAIGISRSAYYKYRNSVFEYIGTDFGKIAEVIIWDEYDRNLLRELFESVPEDVSFLTVNQSLPVNGIATIRITLNPGNQKPRELLTGWRKLHGVRKVEIETLTDSDI